MEDAFVISCHDTPPIAQPTWKGGKEHPVKCSHCQSLHPNEFIYQLRNGGFIRGWVWEKGVPLFCELDAGLFYAVHLHDMSEEWLLANAYTIFENTGLVFYWNREVPVWECAYKGVRMGEGSHVTLTRAQKSWARKLIKEKFYNRRLP